MDRTAKRLFWISLIVLGIAISGCAQSRTTATNAAGLDAATMEKPAQLVNSLGSAISRARTEQVHLLSPDWFEKAETGYLRAREMMEASEKIEKIRKHVDASHRHLAQARSFSATSRGWLTDAIEARNMSRRAGATRYTEEYRLVENDFLKLTRAVERDRSGYVEKNRDAVAQRYRDLEVRAIQEATLGEVRSLISRAEANGAREVAPRSRKRALAQLNAAETFISANPHAEKTRQTMSKEALSAANRLALVTEKGNAMRAMSAEEIVFLLEDYFYAISVELGAQDMRNQDFQTQLDNILGSVDALKKDRAFISEKNQALREEIGALEADYQTRIDELNIKLATLEGQSREDRMAKERMARERMAAEQRLAVERRFNQRYASVRDYFKANEAEVYKQENQLVIRLKAMRFAVGKSMIMPENYDLLTKVQKSIRTFDDPRVIVEGHTDATGSHTVNMQLSQQRADAVREYLIANQTLAPESISAVGYGSERPLASNATSAGRAINRRIDILIVPRAKPM
jgi:outer membrane protein OmpA-like peptidoglycan-associated protein